MSATGFRFGNTGKPVGWELATHQRARGGYNVFRGGVMLGWVGRHGEGFWMYMTETTPALAGSGESRHDVVARLVERYDALLRWRAEYPDEARRVS